MIHLGIAEQNTVLMQLLLTGFGGFTAGLIGLRMLLRFEPNFGLPLCGS
jgi:hypothetical protein